MSKTHRKSPQDQEKHKAKKVARTLIRLQYSLMADDILNDMVPDIDDAVDKATVEATDWSFNVTSLVLDTLNSIHPRLEQK